MLTFPSFGRLASLSLFMPRKNKKVRNIQTSQPNLSLQKVLGALPQASTSQGVASY